MTNSSADAVVELEGTVKDLTLSRGLDLDLECHLNWIHIQDVREQFVESSIEERTEKWLEVHGDSASIQAKLAHHLSQVVFAHWQNDNESAMTQLKKVEELLESEESKELLPLPEHVQAYHYIIQANRAVLAFRMKDFDTSEDVKQKALEFDISEPKAQALILSMKAGILVFAGNTEGGLVLWNQVYELDPSVPEYLVSFAIAIRRLRRLKDNFLQPPSEFEIELAEKAFEIDPDTPRVIYNMTRIYLDILKYSNVDPTYVETCSVLRGIGIDEVLRKLKLFARKGADGNPGSPNAAIRLAEILNYGPKGINGDDEARKQYTHCLETWRDNSHVLHKVGKFMIRGTTADREIGIELLKLSIEKENGNFPALMEYIRVISQTKSTHAAGLEELIDLIEEQLPRFQPKPSHGARLQCVKATLLFKKRELGEAVEIWLKANNMDSGLFKRDPTAFNGKWTLRIPFTGAEYSELRAYVTNMTQNEPADSGRLEGLQEILEAITPKPRPIRVRPNEHPQNSGQRDSSDRLESVRATRAPRSGNPPPSNESLSSSSGSGQGRGRPPPSSFALNAQNDDNWRANPN